MDGSLRHCTGGSYQRHLRKKEMQEGKVIEEALQIAEERREAKGKGERVRYTQL